MKEIIKMQRRAPGFFWPDRGNLRLRFAGDCTSGPENAQGVHKSILAGRLD
jgi:hypothetical protein